MPTVLAIEDDVEARDLLNLVLRGYGYDIVDAPTGREGLAAASERDPDLIIVDLGLPDMSGMDVIRELRTWSSTPVLVLSSSTRRTSRADALDLGADDYLGKPFYAAELGARLRAMARRGRGGQGQEDSGLRRFGALVVDADRSVATIDGVELRLTPTEWRLLEALTRHPGELMTHRWLVAQVWSAMHGRETLASLRVHLRALRAKLGDDPSAPTYLRTESGVGYRWIATAGEDTSASVTPAGVGAQLAALDLATKVVAELDTDLRDGTLAGEEATAARLRLTELADMVDRVIRSSIDPP